MTSVVTVQTGDKGANVEIFDAEGNTIEEFTVERHTIKNVATLYDGRGVQITE